MSSSMRKHDRMHSACIRKKLIRQACRDVRRMKSKEDAQRHQGCDNKSCEARGVLHVRLITLSWDGEVCIFMNANAKVLLWLAPLLASHQSFELHQIRPTNRIQTAHAQGIHLKHETHATPSISATETFDLHSTVLDPIAPACASSLRECCTLVR
jgi:hypothetical protein